LVIDFSMKLPPLLAPKNGEKAMDGLVLPRLPELPHYPHARRANRNQSLTCPPQIQNATSPTITPAPRAATNGAPTHISKRLRPPEFDETLHVNPQAQAMNEQHASFSDGQNTRQAAKRRKPGAPQDNRAQRWRKVVYASGAKAGEPAPPGTQADGKEFVAAQVFRSRKVVYASGAKAGEPAPPGTQADGKEFVSAAAFSKRKVIYASGAKAVCIEPAGS
jgi:hypothetical protein